MKQSDKILFLYVLLLFTFLLSFATVLVPSAFYFLKSENYFLIAAGALVFIILINQIIRKNYKKTEINGLDIAVILFYIWSILNSLIININQDELLSNYIAETLFISIYFIFKFFYIGIDNDEKKRRYYIFSFLILTSIILAIGYLEYFNIIPVYSNECKITGGFINPGSYANCLAILYSFILAILFLSPEHKSKKFRIFVLLLLGLCVYMLFLCKARTAWIACLVSSGFVLSHHKVSKHVLQLILKTTWKKWLLLGVLLIIFSTGSYLLYQMKKDSANGRLFIWQTCLRLIHDKPVFGHGYNSFCRVFNDYQIKYFKETPNDIANGNLADNGMYAFNDYLETTVETGLTGLIIFLFILFLALRMRVKNQSFKSDYLIIANKASLIAIVIGSFFSYPMGAIQNQLLFYLIIGFLSGMNGYRILLKFELKKVLIKISLILAVFITILMEVYAIRQYIYHRQWMKAYNYIEKNDYDMAFAGYDRLYPKLKNDWFFLFNYGSMLPLAERYDESIAILESCRNTRTSLDYYLNLGVSYEAVKAYDKAEECYKEASFLIPYRLIPKYRLFKLYLITGQKQQALQIAWDIDKQPIKVYSPVAGSIKNEILQYLNDNSVVK